MTKVKSSNANLVSSLKAQVAALLAEAGSDILWEFFQSSNPMEDSEYNSDESALGITHEYMANFGGEGEGEQYWSVYKFTKGTEAVYVKFDGSYQSYNGSEYDEFFFVEPKEVTRIEYVKVK